MLCVRRQGDCRRRRGDSAGVEQQEAHQPCRKKGFEDAMDAITIRLEAIAIRLSVQSSFAWVRCGLCVRQASGRAAPKAIHAEMMFFRFDVL